MFRLTRAAQHRFVKKAVADLQDIVSGVSPELRDYIQKGSEDVKQSFSKASITAVQAFYLYLSQTILYGVAKGKAPEAILSDCTVSDAVLSNGASGHPVAEEYTNYWVQVDNGLKNMEELSGLTISDADLAVLRDGYVRIFNARVKETLPQTIQPQCSALPSRLTQNLCKSTRNLCYTILCWRIQAKKGGSYDKQALQNY